MKAIVALACCILLVGMAACNFVSSPASSPSVVPTTVAAPANTDASAMVTAPAASAVPVEAATAAPTAAAVATVSPWAVPSAYPLIERRPAPASWDRNRGKLASVPTYDPRSQDALQVDLRGYDLSGLDLSRSADLVHALFDSRTIWPTAERMPPDFDRQRTLELGKNPGLHIRQLHRAGITGSGVGIAIVDQPLLVEHQEYADRLRLYTEVNIQPDVEAQMHGPAVASLAVGKTVGVAPGADLYYVAAYPGDFVADRDFHYNWRYVAQAFDRIMAVNRSLPAERRIRVISISAGWAAHQDGYEDVQRAVEDAKAAGMLVVSSNVAETFGFRFNALGRQPLSDPDVFESYEPGMWWAENFYASPSSERFRDALMVPMDARTTASPGGADEYVFYRYGGWSWSIPWIAGLYALAAQADPSITPERFRTLAMQTGRTIQLQHDGKDYHLGTIADPVALVHALK